VQQPLKIRHRAAIQQPLKLRFYRSHDASAACKQIAEYLFASLQSARRSCGEHAGRAAQL
jgi:hypothetical protein